MNQKRSWWKLSQKCIYLVYKYTYKYMYRARVWGVYLFPFFSFFLLSTYYYSTGGFSIRLWNLLVVVRMIWMAPEFAVFISCFCCIFWYICCWLLVITHKRCFIWVFIFADCVLFCPLCLSLCVPVLCLHFVDI